MHPAARFELGPLGPLPLVKSHTPRDATAGVALCRLCHRARNQHAATLSIALTATD